MNKIEFYNGDTNALNVDNIDDYLTYVLSNNVNIYRSDLSLHTIFYYIARTEKTAINDITKIANFIRNNQEFIDKKMQLADLQFNFNKFIMSQFKETGKLENALTEAFYSYLSFSHLEYSEHIDVMFIKTELKKIALNCLNEFIRSEIITFKYMNTIKKQDDEIRLFSRIYSFFCQKTKKID
jgi:hypothetical protein